MIISGAQIVAGRALLGCTQERLAELADLNAASVRRYEAQDAIQRGGFMNTYPWAVWRIECAFLRCGLMPILDPGPGIRGKSHGNEKLHGVAEPDTLDDAEICALSHKYARSSARRRARARHGVLDHASANGRESDAPSCTSFGSVPTHGLVAPAPNACGARTRRGAPCKCRALKNGRCKLHGGASTGARTHEGRQRLADAARASWARQRAAGIASGRLVRIDPEGVRP